MSEHSNPWDMNNPTWLIHKTWAGGNSARVLLLTREQGLVWATCHGGWSPKKQAILQAFTPLWTEFTQRQHWSTVRHVEIAGNAFEFTGIYLFSALYINELLYHALRPQDPHLDLYDAYVTSLQNLSLIGSQADLEPILRRFEWHVLTAIGYAMSLTHEAHGHTPIVATHYYQFQPGLGFLPRQNGILGADILALANDELDNPQRLQTAKYLMRRALQHALGGKILQSRAFFAKSQQV